MLRRSEMGILKRQYERFKSDPILVILILLVLAFAVAIPQMRKSPKVEIPIVVFDEGLKPGQIYDVKRITVIEGHTLDIILSDDRRIFSKLDIVSPPEAAQKVKNYFNTCVNPQVKLIAKKDDHIWMVDVVSERDGERQWLSQFLKDQGLIYQR